MNIPTISVCEVLDNFLRMWNCILNILGHQCHNNISVLYSSEVCDHLKPAPTTLPENVSWANPVLIGREKTLMKVTFTEQGITVMHAELAANGERVHRLLLVRRIVASHISDQAHHLQLLKHLTAWRRNNGVEIGLKPGDR